MCTVTWQRAQPLTAWQRVQQKGLLVQWVQSGVGAIVLAESIAAKCPAELNESCDSQATAHGSAYEWPQVPEGRAAINRVAPAWLLQPYASRLG